MFNKIMAMIKNENLNFRARMYGALMLGGIGLSLMALIINLFTSMWASAIFCGILIFLCSGLFVFTYNTGKFQVGYNITIGIIFMILCPIMFFVSGGYYSGMPSVFNLAILFTILMLEGKKAIIISLIEIVEYTIVCAVAYYNPHLLTLFRSEAAVIIDIVLVSSTVSIVSSIILFFHLRDHTFQQKCLQEQNERLKKYDESKSAFLTTVAHEIKNPLNSINLHARDTYELLDEEPLEIDTMKENMKIIEKVVVRIDHIVVDLMDTVAIKQGRLTLSLMPMRLSAMLKDVVSTYFKKENTNGNNIALELDESLPPIKADHARIMQVVTNLLSNACRHTQNGEIIIKLSGDDEGQQISIIDNGTGMGDEMRKKALEGYVSGNKEHWRHGIGLFVCHQIVEAHGGKIWIESKLGEGTTVSFVLPMGEV